MTLRNDSDDGSGSVVVMMVSRACGLVEMRPWRTGARVLPAIRGAVCEIVGTTSHCRGDRWWQRRPSGVNDCRLVDAAVSWRRSVPLTADLRRLSATVAAPGVCRPLGADPSARPPYSLPRQAFPACHRLCRRPIPPGVNWHWGRHEPRTWRHHDGQRSRPGPSLQGCAWIDGAGAECPNMFRQLWIFG
jgi:hypothetical protein